MSIKVAINGFGRIGRLALRQILKTDGIEVVAVNDLTPPDMLVHLFKYDTTQGRFNGNVELKDDGMVVNGQFIKMFANANPEELPWGDLGIDVVLECTGFFTKKDKAELHIKAGAKKVVISAPAGDDVKTVVFGVNHDILDGSETVISGASCTTNCLAPMAAVLQKQFGVVEGLMTTIHAYTGDQNTLDAPHRKGDEQPLGARGVARRRFGLQVDARQPLFEFGDPRRETACAVDCGRRGHLPASRHLGLADRGERSAHRRFVADDGHRGLLALGGQLRRWRRDPGRRRLYRGRDPDRGAAAGVLA